ncbi:MAG: glycosyltransferase family 4 protein [Edaphocola sp.]
MNILIFSYRFFPDFGGIETHSQMLAEHFAANGHRVSVLTTSNAPETPAELPYSVIYRPGFLQVAKAIRIADAVLENNPCFSYSWPMFFFRKKHVVALHTWITGTGNGGPATKYLKKQLLHGASKVIACSNAVKEKTFPNATVIENPYKTDVFFNKNEERTLDFVFVGRFVSDKGIDLAVAAFNRLVLEMGGTRNLTLTLVGDGPEKSIIENRISALNLSKNVRIEGRKTPEEINNILNRHRYILVPSRWEEPFGLVALEGMAAGCWPIVSDGGGLPDAIGGIGSIFERNNEEDLLAKMSKAVAENLSLNRYPEKVKLHLEKHSLQHVGTQFLKELNM